LSTRKDWWMNVCMENCVCMLYVVYFSWIKILERGKIDDCLMKVEDGKFLWQMKNAQNMALSSQSFSVCRENLAFNDRLITILSDLKKLWNQYHVCTK
jgi:hypothetical protein